MALSLCVECVIAAGQLLVLQLRNCFLSVVVLAALVMFGGISRCVLSV